MELQFGTELDGRDHRDRPAVFGILAEAGRIACVRITLDDGAAPYIDLPGGAIDPGETPEAALIREFAEETGLCIAAGESFGAAAQFFVTSRGDAVNNRCRFFRVTPRAGKAVKVEDDHELVWLDPHEAIRRLRHDAHAWGVTAWLRTETSQA